MRVDAVDFFYLAQPEIADVGDGSQDMLLVRVRAGDLTGWGECEASPLTSIASLICPMSHSACHPVIDSVRAQRLDGPADITRIATAVRTASLDLLQADHTLSGIEIALWDLLGKARGEPVFALLGCAEARPKTAYASALFGDSPQGTYAAAREIAAAGFRAAKFGWGPYGQDVRTDAEHVHAAREGLGADRLLCVDAGTVWGEDVTAARLRIPALRDARVTWLEEPFTTWAFGAYRELSGGGVPLAAGEGAHNRHLARQIVDHTGIGYVQIDTGRIGGIGDATAVARYAESCGVRFVNHTFTSQLALSASLQPFAATEGLCEYPVDPAPLAQVASRDRIEPDANGQVHLPERPGLGIEPDPAALRPYLQDVRIEVAGRELYRTPAF
ncbi:MAG TPA: mandelate racemase/muconate lactonizing enzyme family protein [Mycobacteriales bacterium]|nr:mandelate racemase/muconate lactonizing enzyme family protein [Mycobacteriales bacterium]